jgi:hypothetical protein
MQELRFDGKVALITGAGRGIGRAYAELLAARGGQIVVNDAGVATTGDAAGDSPAEEVVEAIVKAGGTAVADGHDVVGDGEQIVARALDEFGRLDIVINNAGVSGGGMFDQIPAGAFDRLVAVHLGGTLAVTRAAWPHLVASGAGRLIITSSPAVFGGTFTSHYITAKAALFGLMRALAAEGALVGITVNAIMPSAYTRLTAQIPSDGFRAMLEAHFPAERIAPFVTWLVHGTTSVTGQAFSVGGGRAARVVLAEAPGVVLGDATPEAWAARAGDLVANGGWTVPASMIDEVRVQVEELGGNALDAFRASGAQQWAGS